MPGHRWFRVDVGYFRHPKVSALSPTAQRLHLAMIGYATEQTTDGFVPDDAMRHICAQLGADWRRAGQRAADQLVTVGLLERLPTGWALHDYDEHNGQALREVRERERELSRERQRRFRLRE